MSMSPAPLIQKPATTTPAAMTEEQQDLARRTVARYSNDAAECREFLAMCGLLPEPGKKPARRRSNYQPPTMQNTGRCLTCKCATYPHTQWRRIPKSERPKGARVYGGRGMCGACHTATLRGDGPKMTAAAPVVEHIQVLRASGRSLRRISLDAGLHPDAACQLLSRKQGRVRSAAAAAFLALPLPEDALEVAS